MQPKLFLAGFFQPAFPMLFVTLSTIRVLKVSNSHKKALEARRGTTQGDWLQPTFAHS